MLVYVALCDLRSQKTFSNFSPLCRESSEQDQSQEDFLSFVGNNTQQTVLADRLVNIKSYLRRIFTWFKVQTYRTCKLSFDRSVIQA